MAVTLEKMNGRPTQPGTYFVKYKSGRYEIIAVHLAPIIYHGGVEFGGYLGYGSSIRDINFLQCTWYSIKDEQ